MNQQEHGVPSGTPSPDPFVALATGKSGDLEIEQAFLKTLGEMYEVFCRKQRDYGRENIAAFGSTGVMVRLTDKIARMSHLFRRGTSPNNESVQDTWVDAAVYGTIGLMCIKGRWPFAWEPVDQIGVD